MITRDQVSEALTFIAETDDAFAEAKTDVERKAWLCKHARAIAFESVEGSVEARKAAVERSEIVTDAETVRLEAFLAFEKLKAKRETKFLLIEVFRTLESSRRAGIV